MSNEADEGCPHEESSATDTRRSPGVPSDAEAELEATSAPSPADSHATTPTMGHSGDFGVGRIASTRVLGDFELKHEIGRGGMGVVYEARQRSLDKRVAVKVLPYSAMLDRRAVKRFQNEAWAAARLQHRNIVPVYQVGNERDIYYYAMQYIDGGDLGDLFDCLQDAATRRTSSRVTQTQTPVAQQDGSDTEEQEFISIDVTTSATDVRDSSDTSVRSRSSTHKSGWSKGDTLASPHLLELVEKSRSTSVPEFLTPLVSMGIQVADALHYAHEMGIVHRDIKPPNLLLDTEGEVWVADFGLAQVQSDAGMTATGAIVGTLRYMSPEQALGNRVGVDHRTDIYSLGVTLYELLTLTRAFSGDNRETILRKITFDDPVRPRRIDRRIPVELETIVMKAMSKNPADRYQTAAEMAEDFRLFRDDKPIKARKPTIPQHIARWARRNRPVVASAAALLVITFIGSMIVAAISWNLFAATAAALETEKEQKAEVQRLLLRSEGLRLAANSSIELDGNPTRAMLLAMEGAKRHPGIHTNTAILEALDAQHEFRTLTGHTGSVGHVAFNADGTKLVSTATQSRFARANEAAMIWDTQTGQLIGRLQDEKTITSAVFSPDKFRILATGSPIPKDAMDDVEGEVTGLSPSLWDSLRFEKLLSFKDAFLFQAHPAVFDPDGRRAVFPSLGRTATVYDCVGGHDLIQLSGHEKRVVFAAFSPQGDRVATASDDNTVRVWDAETGEQVYQFDLWQQRAPDALRCVVDSIVFRSDGRQLVTGSSAFGIHLWDLTTGNRVNDEYLKGRFSEYWPDGLQFLTHTRSGREMTIRDVVEGRTLRTLRPETDLIRRAVISPNGRWIASHGSPDVTLVAIWNASRGEIRTVLKGHRAIVNEIAFSPDSKMIATASSDNTVRLWHVASGRDRATFAAPVWSIDPQAVPSPDGKQLAIIGAESSVVGRLVDIEQPETSIEIPARIWMPEFTSSRVAATEGDRLSIHAVADGSELKSISSAHGRYFTAAINRDGDRVAAATAGGTVTLWFPDQNRSQTLWVGATQIYALRFNDRGDRLVSVSADGYARVWDADTGQLLRSLQNDAKPLDFVFSTDSKQIAVATDQNRAIVWDLDSFEKVTTLQSPQANFDRVAFSFDNARLVTFHVSGSEAIHSWDAQTGDLESTFDVPGQVHVAMHPSLNEALVTSTDKGVSIWQFVENTRKPVSDEPMVHGAFTQNGSKFVVASEVKMAPQPWLPPSPSTFTRSVLQRWSHDDLTKEHAIEIPAGSVTEFFLDHEGHAFVNVSQAFGVVNHDVATHQPSAHIAGHIAPISESVFTSDSRRLVTASWDEEIAVWDASSGERLRTLVGHESPVYCIAISHDDQFLLSGADDGKCILWDLESGEIKNKFNLTQTPIRHVALAPDGNQFFAITSENVFHLYDLKASQSVDLDVGTPSVAWAEYSPDGASLLVIPNAEPEPEVNDQDSRLSNDEAEHRVLIVPVDGKAMTSIQHEGPVITAHFHPAGDRFLSATRTGKATLRSVDSGQVEATFPHAGNDLTAVALSNSGEFVAVAGRKRVTIWKVDDQMQWMSVPKKRPYPKPQHDYDPFIPGTNRIVTQRPVTADFRDWSIEPLEFANARKPRSVTAEEKALFLLDESPEQ